MECKQSYRKDKIRSVEHELELEMHKYTQILKTYNRLDKVIFFALAIINSLGMMGLTMLSKRINKKRKKHKDTVHLIKTSKSKIEDTVSKALDDDDISNIEFTGIVKCLDFYYDEKQHLRQHRKDLTAHALLYKCVVPKVMSHFGGKMLNFYYKIGTGLSTLLKSNYGRDMRQQYRINMINTTSKMDINERSYQVLMEQDLPQIVKTIDMAGVDEMNLKIV
ncbi:unnamed protein product [Mytilus coruscus]|uniref:Uncharacterized protein n=1 Tax=Mytilus coruscus TaxID=42192 RepID=A0A6J8DSU2_MYTCO|nr:unnamed protein product [Mytilus coruscus]